MYVILQLSVLGCIKMSSNLTGNVRQRGNVNNVFGESSSIYRNENGGSDSGCAKKKHLRQLLT